MTTVLVTRPAGADHQLVRELESRGYHVIAVPTVLTRRLEVVWPQLDQFDWIVVTSAAAVKVLPDVPAGPRCAVIGQATAVALRARGVQADFVPDEANGAALGNALPEVQGKRVLLVRGSLADPDLPAALSRRGGQVDEITVYETVEGPAESRPHLQRALAERDVAAVIFASGSAVRGFLNLGGSVDVPAITIGPRTSAVAKEAGFRIAAEATTPAVEQLADAVRRAIPIEVGRDA